MTKRHRRNRDESHRTGPADPEIDTDRCDGTM